MMHCQLTHVHHKMASDPACLEATTETTPQTMPVLWRTLRRDVRVHTAQCGIQILPVRAILHTSLLSIAQLSRLTQRTAVTGYSLYFCCHKHTTQPLALWNLASANIRSSSELSIRRRSTVHGVDHGLETGESHVSVIDSGKTSFFFRNVHSGSRAHRFLYNDCVDRGRFSLGIKRSGREVDQSSNLEPRLRMSGVMPPVPTYVYVAWYSIKERKSVHLCWLRHTSCA